MLELKQLTFKEVLIINNLIEKEDVKIENMIYEVRGKQVMFVSDVAKLYHVETRIVNQTIKRNINRFPEEFCFQLTSLEWESLRSQFVISNDKTSELTRGGVRYLPYVLTEHEEAFIINDLIESDLAKLYHLETKRINEAVKNNREKFPERFSWKLTEEESEVFLVENFDQNLETRGGRYNCPRVFTEQGVAMRKYISTDLIEQKYIIIGGYGY